MYYRNRKKAAIGFYVATGICLVAIGVAAVLSYSQISKNPVENAKDTSTAQTQNDVSGVEKENTNSGSYTQKPNDNAQTSTNENSSDKSQTSKPDNPKETGQKSESSAKEDSEDSSSSKPSTVKTNVEPLSNNSSFVLPVGNTVTKNYSSGELVFSETMRDYRVHNGTDFAADRGSVVQSIGYGTVTKIYSDNLLGNVILINYGNYDVYFCGLGSTSLVKVGDTVSPQQNIGSILEVPSEVIEPSHLHLEVKSGGNYIDPMSLFK